MYLRLLWRTRHRNLQVTERDGDDYAEVSCTTCLFGHLSRIYWRRPQPVTLSTRERILVQEAARAAAHAAAREAADAATRALAPHVAQELARVVMRDAARTG